MERAAAASTHVLAFVTRDREGAVLESCWRAWWSHANRFGDGGAFHLRLHAHDVPANITASAPQVRWRHILNAKVSFVHDAIKTLPLGALALFTDLDVIPLRSYLGTLLPPPYTLTFMREPPGHGGRTGRHIVNTGLYALRVMPETKKFVAHWRRLARGYPRLNDQDTANWLLLAKRGSRLHQAGLEWGTWPRTLATGLLPDVSNSTAAFHAIFVPGAQAKLQRIGEAIGIARTGSLPPGGAHSDHGPSTLPSCSMQGSLAA